MKKIVGILAGAALLATSVFAADVSAKVNILGDLFNFDTSSKKVNALGIAEGGQSWNPSFAMSVSGDEAGASMKFYDSGATEAVSNVNYNIWFKPVDILTVQVGNWSTNLNQETIDYSNTASGVDDNGFALCLNTNGFEFDVFFITGWSGNNFGWNRWGNVKPWLSYADGADKVTIGETYIKVAYSADFGTISAYADLNTSVGNDMGIGYKGSFGPVTAFANVITGFDKDWKFGIVRGEVFGTTNIDSIGISAFVVGGYATDKVTVIAKDKLANVTKKGAFVGATAKVTFPAGPFNGYVCLKDDNFMAKDFSLEIKPGLTGNVGTMSWDLAIDFYAQEKIKVDVPVTFTLAY